MRIFINALVICTFFVGCAVESVQITYTKRAKCDKKLAESYGIFTTSLLGDVKFTALELYTDSTFMFAGDLSLHTTNQIFCSRGPYKKTQEFLQLWELNRTIHTVGTFHHFPDLYLFAPLDDATNSLHLYKDEKEKYKITHVYDSKARKQREGFFNTRAGQLVDSVAYGQNYLLEKIAFKKSIFNCQCPTENLFPIYQKLFPEDAKKRHGRMPK